MAIVTTLLQTDRPIRYEERKGLVHDWQRTANSASSAIESRGQSSVVIVNIKAGIGILHKAKRGTRRTNCQSGTGTENMTPKLHMTIAIDKYGRVYDLSKEHPSWEAARKAKKDGTEERCIVVNAMTCTPAEFKKMKRKRKKGERKCPK